MTTNPQLIKSIVQSLGGGALTRFKPTAPRGIARKTRRAQTAKPRTALHFKKLTEAEKIAKAIGKTLEEKGLKKLIDVADSKLTKSASDAKNKSKRAIDGWAKIGRITKRSVENYDEEDRQERAAAYRKKHGLIEPGAASRKPFSLSSLFGHESDTDEKEPPRPPPPRPAPPSKKSSAKKEKTERRKEKLKELSSAQAWAERQAQSQADIRELMRTPKPEVTRKIIGYTVRDDREGHYDVSKSPDRTPRRSSRTAAKKQGSGSGLSIAIPKPVKHYR